MKQVSHHLFEDKGSMMASALIRIGLVLLCWARFASDLMPMKHIGDPIWLVHAGLFYGLSLLTLVGVRTQLSCLLFGVVLLSMRHTLGFAMDHEPYTHHHTHVLALATFLLGLSPCGRTLSLDAWRRPGPAVGSLLGPRMITVLLSTIYFYGTLSKLTPQFLSGARLEQIFRHAYVGSDPFGPWFVWFCGLGTWGTLFLEAFLVIALWVRPWRSWAIGLGITFHLVIYVSLPVGTFSLTMILLYLAAVDPAVVDQAVRRLARMQSASG